MAELDESLSLSPDENDLMIDEGFDEDNKTLKDNDRLMDGEDNSVTSAIIRDKVGYSAQLNKSQQGSALLDVVRTSKRRQVRIEIGKDGDKPNKGKGPDISDEVTDIPKLKISVPENTSPDELFCSKLGLKDVCLQYSDADYENLTSYKLFQAKFKADIKSANPNVKMAKVNLLVGAKWKTFSEQKKALNGSDANDGQRVFIYNVGEETTFENVQEPLEKYGKVTDFNNTGKGFAFVNFKTREGAQACVAKLDMKNLAGKTVQVSIARPKMNKLKTKEKDQMDPGLRLKKQSISSGFRGSIKPNPELFQRKVDDSGFVASSTNINAELFERKPNVNDPRLKPVTVTQPSLDLKMKMRYCCKYFGIQLFYNDCLFFSDKSIGNLVASSNSEDESKINISAKSKIKQNPMPIVSPSNSPPLTSSLKYVASPTKSLSNVGDGGLSLPEKRVPNFSPKAREPSTFR